MELGSHSEDQLDQLIVRAESEIGVWRVVEMAAIVEKRRRRSHLADGYGRSWIGQRLGLMSLIRPPVICVGRRLVSWRLPMWSNR